MLEVASFCKGFTIIIKGILLAKNISYQSNDRRHAIDCIQQGFQQRFDYTHNLEALEICVSNSLECVVMNDRTITKLI